MHRRLFDLYQRKRVININANIIASGLLAVAVAKYPVLLIGRYIGEQHRLVITFAAGGIDMFVDVLLYYALHWIANHWNPPWKRKPRPKPKRSFFHEASLVQFERAILSPIYYLVAMGLMYYLQIRGLGHSWAFVIGFASGLVVTRVLHTIWGVRSGRFADSPHDAGLEDERPARDATPAP
ncbi:MAG: hypothetical protein IPJ41_12950 [Phycisphaerales bacterium]|nr:hypothetical protein [Phycisphaerales bacterium]